MRLSGGGDFAGANGPVSYSLISVLLLLLTWVRIEGIGYGSLPDRLVSNDDLGPLVLSQEFGDGVKLACDDVDGLVGFALLFVVF